MQPSEIVACDEASGGQGDYAMHWRIDLEAGGLGAGPNVPEPDRVVIGRRGEPPIEQHAQRPDRIRVAFESGGLGAGPYVPQPGRSDRQIPQPDRAVSRARDELPVGQHAQRGNLTRVPVEAGGPGPGPHVPEPDRLVLGPRGEPPVGQRAQRTDRIRVPSVAGLGDAGLGPGRRVPDPDRIVLVML
jgi:hypothetical protein